RPTQHGDPRNDARCPESARRRGGQGGGHLGRHPAAHAEAQMKKRLIDFLYNADRAIASLFGAPPHETISSEISRHAATNPVAEEAEDVLDDIQKNHCENAVLHADKLDAAYNGKEQ